MKKILMFPVNLLVWLSHNPAEGIIMSIFVTSILTLSIDIKHPVIIGGMLSFISMLMAYIIKRTENRKSSRLYEIFILIILLLGVVGFFIIGNKQAKDIYSPIQIFFCVYTGAFWGMMMGTLLFAMIEDERHRNKMQQRVETKKEIASNSIPENASSFVTPEKDIPIRSCDGEKIIGYIDKAEYNSFIYKNIRKI